MRNLYLLNQYRVTNRLALAAFNGWAGDETCGLFVVPSPIDGGELRVVASSGEGWDHVSVSRAKRCPNWPEMSHIHGLFFKNDEAAMQLHVPVEDHINNHPYCLHLWCPHHAKIPRPPGNLVGIKDAGTFKSADEALAAKRAAGLL